MEKYTYTGKNIDELCKYLGKIEIIDKIAERLSTKENIIAFSIVFFYETKTE